MGETRRTLIFTGAAVVLTVLALVTAPRRVTPNAFVDQGELLFPDFTNPNDAKTLEVIDFDEQTGEAIPFKVTFSRGRWTIPSHYDHPADGKDRLAETAAGVMLIKKDDFRSDNIADHELCGVIDPLDETVTKLTGRGKRVTLKGANDVVLADIIIGEEVEGREKMRFVRVPGQKRVYAARVDVDVSTKFSDWIESDLLQVKKDRIDQVIIKDYTVNERTGVLDDKGMLVLNKNGDDWEAANARDDEEVDRYKMTNFLTALEELKIEGVRPKPKGLTSSLSVAPDKMEISTADMLSLQNAGYFFTKDGRLVSNEGEMQVETDQGIIYTLRFGEIVYGSGLAVSAGTESGDGPDEDAGEYRYLFITTRFDADKFPEPVAPANTDFLGKVDSLLTEEDRNNKTLYTAHKKWNEKQKSRQNASDDLNRRFARWYYVISGESFNKLRLAKSDVLKEKNGT